MTVVYRRLLRWIAVAYRFGRWHLTEFRALLQDSSVGHLTESRALQDSSAWDRPQLWALHSSSLHLTELRALQDSSAWDRPELWALQSSVLGSQRADLSLEQGSEMSKL